MFRELKSSIYQKNFKSDWVPLILGSGLRVSVEQFWGEEAGGSNLEARHRLVLLDLIASLPFLGVETSESVNTSPCIELTSELHETRR